jgi:hypothetical protein
MELLNIYCKDVSDCRLDLKTLKDLLIKDLKTLKDLLIKDFHVLLMMSHFMSQYRIPPQMHSAA